MTAKKEEEPLTSARLSVAFLTPSLVQSVMSLRFTRVHVSFATNYSTPSNFQTLTVHSAAFVGEKV